MTPKASISFLTENTFIDKSICILQIFGVRTSLNKDIALEKIKNPNPVRKYLHPTHLYQD